MEDFETRKKQEREGSADMIRADLVKALELLDKAKSEMVGGDLGSSWKTMEEVEALAGGLHNATEQLRIRLRQEAES